MQLVDNIKGCGSNPYHKHYNERTSYTTKTSHRIRKRRKVEINDIQFRKLLIEFNRLRTNVFTRVSLTRISQVRMVIAEFDEVY